MNIFSKILSAFTSTNQQGKIQKSEAYLEGMNHFEVGRKLFSEAVLDKSFDNERRKQKKIAALEFLDRSIEVGYNDAEVFCIRGMCLRDLNFDVDAIEDFDRCIEINPSKASYYYDRALTKELICDYEGSLIDFEKAIELSKLENHDTLFWNNYAKESGFNSATQKYEYDLEFLKMTIKNSSEDLRFELHKRAINEKRRKL